MRNKKRNQRQQKTGKRHLKLKFFLFIIFVFIMFIIGFIAKDARSYMYEGTPSTSLKYVQTYLVHKGYYHGEIDGMYGDETDHAITAYKEDHKFLKRFIKDKDYSTTDEDINLIARVVSGEARGESYEGKVAVAAVIFNRVEDGGFPDTIQDVIYQNRAFDAVADGQININPDESCYKAALDAKRGWDPSRGALYYYNPDTATDDWIKTRTEIVTIGNHVFCK